MTSPRIKYAGAAGLIILAAAGVATWRHVRAPRPAMAGLATLPDVSRWPEAFRLELDRVIEEVKRGREPVVALGRLATLYFANDLLAEAEQALRTLQRLDPANPRWPYFHAILLSRRNEFAGAEPLFRETLRLAPDYSAARVQLGQLLASAGRDDEARSFYEQRLANEPGDVLATLGLVDIDRRAGQQRTAVARLENLLRVKPAAAEARLLLAEILDSEGRAAEASAHRLAAQSSGVATPVQDPWLDELYLQSFDPFRLQTLGMIRFNAGAANDALPYLQRSAALAPDDSDVQDSYASALLRAGRRDEARAVLNAALERTNSAIIHVRLADLLIAEGRLDEAEALLRRGLSTHAGQADVHEALGRVALRASRFDEACAAFSEALRLKPTMPEAQLNLGRAQFAAGRRDDARRAIARAVEMRPSWPDALLALGELELEAKRLTEAQALAARALNAKAGSPAIMEFAAKVALARASEALAAGNSAEAEKIFNEALLRTPDHGPLHGASAASLGKQGRLSEARTEARRYAELAPNDARAWFLLGTVCEQLGERSEARSAYARGLEAARAAGDTRRTPLLEQALNRLGQ